MTVSGEAILLYDFTEEKMYRVDLNPMSPRHWAAVQRRPQRPLSQLAAYRDFVFSPVKGREKSIAEYFGVRITCLRKIKEAPLPILWDSPPRIDLSADSTDPAAEEAEQPPAWEPERPTAGEPERPISPTTTEPALKRRRIALGCTNRHSAIVACVMGGKRVKGINFRDNSEDGEGELVIKFGNED